MIPETFAAVCAVPMPQIVVPPGAQGTGWCTGSTGSGDPDD